MLRDEEALQASHEQYLCEKMEGAGGAVIVLRMPFHVLGLEVVLYSPPCPISHALRIWSTTFTRSQRLVQQ